MGTADLRGLTRLDEGTIRLLRRTPYERIVDAWDMIHAAIGDPIHADRMLALDDRYYLLTVMLGRTDAMHHWLYARCREVEADPDGYLDLWAREHYKSTVITFAGIIQEVLRDPDLTVGIFSHTKPIAKGFLIQIKREFESNHRLRAAFPDILWDAPHREAPQWSVDGGIVVRRSSNPKEATIEAHGLVDGQPTSKHFSLLVYDDVVTLESVGTPEQITKTTTAWSLSDNLGARGADGRIRKWHIGTRYHFSDTYHTMMERGSVKPRIYPATDNGQVEGNPVMLTRKAWSEKVRDQVRSVLAAQMLQNPAAGNQAIFDKDWLRFTDVRPSTLNVYIMCDPASSRKKSADSTAFAVIGIDANGNKYLLDGARDKLKLSDRWRMLRYFYERWTRMPGVQHVKAGYERYGMQSDLEYFEERMEIERFHFPVIELAWPREGGNSKVDRVQRLEPDFRNGRFYLAYKPKANESVPTKNQQRVIAAGQPWRCLNPTRRKDWEGNVYALNKQFLDEYLVFPFAVHDDLIDAVSRIYDMDPVTPVIIDDRLLEPEVYEDGL